MARSMLSGDAGLAANITCNSGKLILIRFSSSNDVSFCKSPSMINNLKLPSAINLNVSSSVSASEISKSILLSFKGFFISRPLKYCDKMILVSESLPKISTLRVSICKQKFVWCHNLMVYSSEGCLTYSLHNTCLRSNCQQV